MPLCNRHPHGARPSISVWCSHVCTSRRKSRRNTLPEADDAWLEAQRKKLENPLLGRVCLLTTGVLISVRLGMTLRRVPVPGFFCLDTTLCLGTDAHRASGPRGIAEVRHDLAG